MIGFLLICLGLFAHYVYQKLSKIFIVSGLMLSNTKKYQNLHFEKKVYKNIIKKFIENKKNN